MNDQWPCKFSYKNPTSFLRYQPNTAGDYFILPHPVHTDTQIYRHYTYTLIIYNASVQTFSHHFTLTFTAKTFTLSIYLCHIFFNLISVQGEQNTNRGTTQLGTNNLPRVVP